MLREFQTFQICFMLTNIVERKKSVYDARITACKRGKRYLYNSVTHRTESIIFRQAETCIIKTKRSQTLNEPCHEIMVLFILRKLIFQTRMRSHPVGLDVCLFGQTLHLLPYFMCANRKALAGLRVYAGSPEPSLVAYVTSTIIWLKRSCFNNRQHKYYSLYSSPSLFP